MISPRRFLALAWCLIALVLLAEGPAATIAGRHEIALTQPGAVAAPAIGREVDGRGGSAARADRPDPADSGDPLAVLVAVPELAPVQAGLEVGSPPCPPAPPPTHRSCAGLPTGPPTA